MYIKLAVYYLTMQTCSSFQSVVNNFHENVTSINENRNVNNSPLMM